MRIAHAAQNPERTDGIPEHRQRHRQTHPHVGPCNLSKHLRGGLHRLELHAEEQRHAIKDKREEGRSQDIEPPPENLTGRREPQTRDKTENHGQQSAPKRRPEVKRKQLKSECPELQEGKQREKPHQQRQRTQSRAAVGTKPQHTCKKQVQDKDKMSDRIKNFFEHSPQFCFTQSDIQQIARFSHYIIELFIPMNVFVLRI